MTSIVGIGVETADMLVQGFQNGGGRHNGWI
jgi:hypothetical protein